MVNKTASIDYFIKQKQDEELIFQQFYLKFYKMKLNKSK
ncbi:PF07601 family protein [Leptospira interrogans str. HAI1594]|uniref:Uncharacterized protein n=1 Tax=Leptospira interrogans serovar Hardjo str. Norma TaxID=1279460 RepID=A0A0M5L913_LEPIR|nr:hypothetical protein G436_3924 [Leptospira interrogans serovar Hardjo str. Norma]EKP76842.1 PF07601 family protein [Leptospira interrogans str. HAI1594]